MDTQEIQLKKLESIDASLQLLLKYFRIVSQPIIKEVLEKTLNTQEKRLVYNLMDGEKTVANIQKFSGVNARFISEWGKEWEKLGIVEEISATRGRRKKQFDLSLYNIPITNTEKSEKSNETVD